MNITWGRVWSSTWLFLQSFTNVTGSSVGWSFVLCLPESQRRGSGGGQSSCHLPPSEGMGKPQRNALQKWLLLFFFKQINNGKIEELFLSRGVYFFLLFLLTFLGKLDKLPFSPPDTPPPPCMPLTKACQLVFSPNRVERRGNADNKWFGSTRQSSSLPLSLSLLLLNCETLSLPLILSSAVPPSSQMNEVEIGQKHVTGFCHCS